MTAAHTALDDLKRRRPEWQPWLVVVQETLREAATDAWEPTVPAVAEARPHTAPLLAGAVLSLRASAVRRLLQGLIQMASRDGSAKMFTLRAALRADLDMLGLFAASLAQDTARVQEIAAASGVDGEALQAVAALLPVPLLQACHRRWKSSISPAWGDGYCPVCASWPAFAEVRGIERSRFFRCGRCGGAEWHCHALQCPYCAMNAHDELVALVPEHDSSHAVIEGCRRCRGYVKTLTRLQGCPPDAVMIEDLASVHLDLAALEQGYARPQGAGCALDVAVSDTPATRRFFGWHA